MPNPLVQRAYATKGDPKVPLRDRLEAHAVVLEHLSAAGDSAKLEHIAEALADLCRAAARHE